MPRGPRLDAPGCVQHVMLRGVERRRIFHDDRDRWDLLDRLGRVLPEAQMPCFAWALMPNHVHLVLRTGPVPLSRVMARVGTGYAQAFNRRHDRVGHLFQNRYKSILVGEETQLLVLVRYVHRNPLRAGLVPSLEALARHPWTGHATLLGHATTPFQDTQTLLARFGGEVPEARRRLLAWMHVEPGPEHAGCDAPPAESPERRACSDRRASLDAVIAEVCAGRGLLQGDVRSRSRTRAITDARAEIVRRACDELGIAGADVARALGISEPAVSELRKRAGALVPTGPVPPG